MFFGIDWFTALIKISFQVVFSIVTAIPMYFAWNCVAPIYLTMIPTVYLSLPFWHIVGIFLVCAYIGEMISKLTPTIVSVNNSN